MKNKLREREREREGEETFQCEKTMHRIKKNCQIRSKMLRIRRVKINEDKKIDKK